MTLQEAIEARHSVRAYKDQPLSKEIVKVLEGFKDTPTSVRKTVETIKTHPLVPRDIVVRGFIIDSETGALEEIF